MTRALCLYGIVHGTKRKWNDGTVFMTTGVGPRHYPQSNKYQKERGVKIRHKWTARRVITITNSDIIIFINRLLNLRQ